MQNTPRESKGRVAIGNADLKHRRQRRSRNQKFRAYDLVKTAFLFRFRSAYDLVKTRLSESGAEAEELNQSQSVGTCAVIGVQLRLLLLTPTIWLSLDHNRNVSDGVVSGVGRNGNGLILVTSDVALMTPLTTPIFDFH